MEQQVLQGLRHPAANFTHAHSQYLSALASGGLIGGLGLFLLFVIPLKLFVEAYKEGSESMRQLSMAGILLLVAYLHFALTEAILERMLSTTFLAFYLAVLMVAIHRQRQELMAEPVQRKQRLSVSIIAVNEADRIEQCLDSVSGWADEIVILDSGSTDDTVSIARRYTDQIYETDWPGYGLQKQRALEKASGDWVLSIDADEVLTPELRRDIDHALNDHPDCIAYRLPWAVTIYGHRLDFGHSGRAPLRLFRREGVRFSEDQVHETVILPQGKIGKLHGRLLHFTHRDYGHALYKNAHYAWLGAQKRFDRGKKGGGLVMAFLRSIWTFFLVYILRLGFLDGRVGFLMAMIYSQNSFNKYAGLWTLRQQA
jgi:(heptosyl)LPS beta-1,4-glucosyltransferase